MRFSSFVLLLLLLCSASCGKLPHNQQLEGQWQLLSINGQPVQGQRYWRLQLGYWQSFTLHAQSPSDSQNYIAHYEQRGDSLHLFSPYLIRRDLGVDSLVSDSHTLDFSPSGIHSFPASWRIVLLDDERLQLEKDKQVLLFRKF